jgi:Protein of unknown function (DUF3631)
MSKWTPKALARLMKLFSMMTAGGTPAERENSRAKVEALLKRHGDTINDLAARIAEAQAATAPPSTPPPPPAGAPTSGADLFYLTRDLFRLFIWFPEPAYYDAVALWAMHTHVYRRFRLSPRLHLRSAIEGEGKSTVLNVLAEILVNPLRADNITASALMWRLNEWPKPALIDEADNLDLLNDPTFRAILNGNHEDARRETREGAFRYYAPIALASIGSLPLPLARRSIVLQLARASRAELEGLSRFDKQVPWQAEAFEVVRRGLAFWAANVDDLDRDPPLPDALASSPRDAWRPLVSIADACGLEVGEITRATAVAISGGHGDNPRVQVLADLKAIFDSDDRLAPDVKASDLAVHAAINSRLQLTTRTILTNLYDINPSWLAWSGESGQQAPRLLTEAALSKLLKDFRVYSSTLWPSPRPAGARSAKGYKRDERLEAAWASYLDDDFESGAGGTAGKISRLGRHT